MEDVEAAAPAEAATSVRAAPRRPQFSENEQYAPLLSIFDVSSLSELDDVQKYPFSAFKAKAAGHSQGGARPRPPASFTSWKMIIGELLTVHASEHERSTPGGGGAQQHADPAAAHSAAEAAAGEEEVDGGVVAEGCALVHMILAGGDLTELPDMTDEHYGHLVAAFEARMAEVEAIAKEKFAAMTTDESSSVADLRDMVKVRAP